MMKVRARMMWGQRRPPHPCGRTESCTLRILTDAFTGAHGRDKKVRMGDKGASSWGEKWPPYLRRGVVPVSSARGARSAASPLFGSTLDSGWLEDGICRDPTHCKVPPLSPPPRPRGRGPRRESNLSVTYLIDGPLPVSSIRQEVSPRHPSTRSAPRGA